VKGLLSSLLSKGGLFFTLLVALEKRPAENPFPVNPHVWNAVLVERYDEKQTADTLSNQFGSGEA